MKTTLGIIGIIAGIALGLYVGIYVCLVGGIVGIVTVVNTMIDGGSIDAGLIAWSIVRIMCAGLAGGLSAYALIIPSYAALAIPSRYRIKRK